MQKQSSFQLYRLCLFSNISRYIGQLVSIVGKITQINQQQQHLIIQVDPSTAQSLKVIVHEFEISYLFDDKSIDNINDKADLVLAERIINRSKINGKSSSTAKEGNYTSLMWFVVQEGHSPLDQIAKKRLQEEQSNGDGLSWKALRKKINVGEFAVGQYIESTIQMKEFTDFEDNYDLASHNYALGLGLQYCDRILI